MSALPHLKPVEAAYIACNAYFALEGWDKRYKNDDVSNSVVKAGVASPSVINKQVVGGGAASLQKVNIKGTVKKSLVGETGSRLNKASSGFGYMLTFNRAGKKHLVIATRGTRLEMGAGYDGITDANISPLRAFPGVGPVHAGFYDCFNSMNDQLDSALIRSVDYVHCVGHSLGGAVANLVALQASKITGKKNVCLYTFGAPRVGLEVAGYHRVACRLLGEDNIFRISHDLDPVPMVCLPPYQHVHPSILAKQNFLLRSPFDALSIDNHDTGQYIASCVNKSWTGLGAAPLTQLEIDRQFFQKWINDDSWIKNKLGMTGNIVLGTLIKIVKGLVARSAMLAGMGIASAIDLIAIAVDKGVKLLNGVSEFAIKLISEIAKAFGIVVQESKSFLMGLLAKMKAHITVLTKRAMIKASKLSQSREFQSILEGAQSIGLILM